mgnify:CR=1 FL=1
MTQKLFVFAAFVRGLGVDSMLECGYRSASTEAEAVGAYMGFLNRKYPTSEYMAPAVKWIEVTESDFAKIGYFKEAANG